MATNNKPIEFSTYYYPGDDASKAKWIRFELDLESCDLLETATSKESKFAIIKEFLKRTKRNIQDDYNNLEDEVARFKGISVGYKAKFEKAYIEQSEAIEKTFSDIYSNIEKVKSKVDSKIQEMSNSLKPVLETVLELESKLKSFDNYGLEKLTKTLSMVEALRGTEKDMFQFLVKNFNK